MSVSWVVREREGVVLSYQRKVQVMEVVFCERIRGRRQLADSCSGLSGCTASPTQRLLQEPRSHLLNVGGAGVEC
jgi:hypothetical protein